MPCPLFEPCTRVVQPPETTARLPLIFEFEGICHAGDEAPNALHRLRYCNHGNARGHCASFPAAQAVSAIRFDVTATTPRMLSVLVIEEENYWPRSWSNFDFVIAEERLEPEIEDICRRAQVFQFCRSYLEKFKCQ